MSEEGSPEIIECEIRLHRARPAGHGEGELSWADWSEMIVGGPVTFEAIAITDKGAWNGPLSPGVEVSSPEALDDPWWTVFLPAARGVPVLVGRVGHALGTGEPFLLPAGEPGVWVEGVVFDGAIVVE